MREDNKQQVSIQGKGPEKRKKSFRQRFTPKNVFVLVLIVIVLSAVSFMTVEKASANPAFCNLCHNMKPMYNSYNDSNLLAHAHKQAGVSCHDCHESSIPVQMEEGVKYITGDFETPMKTREFSKEMCLKCHNYNEVKAKTNFEESNPHDSHNGDLECFKCHKMHESSNVFCAKCHNFSWFKDLPAYFTK